MLLGTDVIVGGIRVEHPVAETAESFSHVGGRKRQQRLEVRWCMSLIAVVELATFLHMWSWYFLITIK